MCDYCFEVLDTDNDVHIFIECKIVEILNVNGNRGLERLLENLFAVHDLLCKTCKDCLSILGEHIELFSARTKVFDVLAHDSS